MAYARLCPAAHLPLILRNLISEKINNFQQKRLQSMEQKKLPKMFHEEHSCVLQYFHAPKWPGSPISIP